MEDVLLHTSDSRNVTTLTLNRPDRLNAFDDALIAALTAALDRIEHDSAIRALVLRGAGRAFCAGGDLDWMRRMSGYAEAENLEDARRLAEMLHRLDTLRVPTVAMVQGAAYGGGVGLAACCDIVIAGHSARFCLSETRMGLIPATIGPYVIAAIGARQARRYFTTAEVIDPDRALLLGLAHEVVADDGMLPRCDAVLKALLAGRPQAQIEAKRLVAEIAHRPVDAALIEHTSRRIAERRAQPEAREAIAAFLARG